VLDADMAETVKLAADADPALDDVVIVGALFDRARNAGPPGLVILNARDKAGVLDRRECRA
jgi:hypothetical protein